MSIYFLPLLLLPAVLAADFSRVTNGTVVPQGQAPFLVRLLLGHDSGYGLCGGTIIDETTVVTAAHCVYHKTLFTHTVQDPARAYVFFGNNSASNHNYIHPTSITVHPDYDPHTTHNDIAVMRVPHLPSMGGNVSPILFYDGALTPKEPIQIYGWGTTRSHGTSADNPPALLTQEVFISEPDDCQVIEPQYNDANGPQICANNNYNVGVDVCQGDSGTGVTVKYMGKQYYVGLVSYGTDAKGHATCGEAGSFGVYTNVHYYLKWIESMTGNTYQVGPYQAGSQSALPMPTGTDFDDYYNPSPSNTCLFFGLICF